MDLSKFSMAPRAMKSMMLDDKLMVGGELLSVRRIQQLVEQGVELNGIELWLLPTTVESAATHIHLLAHEDQVFDVYNQIVKNSRVVNKKVMMLAFVAGVTISVVILGRGKKSARDVTRSHNSHQGNKSETAR